MVPELRKRHRQVWRLMAVALPAGFMLAVLVLPRRNYPDKLPAPAGQAWEMAGESLETEELAVNLRKKAGAPGQQLEITVRKPFKAPAARIYWQDQFVGSLGARGIHRYYLDSTLFSHPPFTLKIVDPINEVILQKMDFPQ